MCVYVNIYTAIRIICNMLPNYMNKIIHAFIVATVLKFLITSKFLDVLKHHFKRPYFHLEAATAYVKVMRN